MDAPLVLTCLFEGPGPGHTNDLLSKYQPSGPYFVKQNKGLSQHFVNLQIALKPAILQLHACKFVTSSSPLPVTKFQACTAVAGFRAIFKILALALIWLEIGCSQQES